MSNETRLGAVADLAFALERCGVADFDVVVAVAGDTLFEKSVDVKASFGECFCFPSYRIEQSLVRGFLESDEDALTLGYPMSDPATQCRSRGVLQLGPDGRRVVAFAEKPPEPLPASLASAPLYIYRRSVLPRLTAYLAAKRAANAKVSQRVCVCGGGCVRCF